MFSCDEFEHLVVHILDRGRVRHRDQRAEALQKFLIRMIGVRHPPMIGMLRIACVLALALIWARRRKKFPSVIATSILRFLTGVRGWVTGPGYGKS